MTEKMFTVTIVKLLLEMEHFSQAGFIARKLSLNRFQKVVDSVIVPLYFDTTINIK
jgi:hypothetical protein